jgi:hypothetical protein
VNMYPKFKIHKVKEEANGLELVGNLSSDSCGNEKWIDDNWLGYLKDNDFMVYGRWHKDNGEWKFFVKSEDASGVDFTVGQEVTVFDSYWGERVELVLNRKIKWREAIYKAKVNWDHDHCAICWATISEIENREYMLGDDRVEICLSCFESYIKQNSFGFIGCA